MLKILEEIHPSVVEKKKKTTEYDLGTEIWNTLKAGQCVLIEDVDINPSSVKTRLNRINDTRPEDEHKEFKYIRQEDKTIKFYRIS